MLYKQKKDMGYTIVEFVMIAMIFGTIFLLILPTSDKIINRFKQKEATGIIEDLEANAYSILDANFDDQKEANKLSDRIIEKFEKFQDFYAKGDKQYEKRLKREIKELLINYKAYHVLPVG